MKKASPQSLAQAKQIAEYLNYLSASGYGDDHRRLDADETNMLALSLEQMRARVYEDEYPELKARKFCPIASDIDPGADSFAYEEIREVGKAQEIADGHYADDIKSVETSGTKITHGVISLGDGFEYSIQDLKRAAFSGKPLQARKATAARRIYERGLDTIAAFGSPSGKIPSGLLNKATGTSAGQIRSTAMTSAAWDATPVAADMVSDLCKAVAEMVSDSEETQEPNILILPTLQYLRLAHTYTTDGSPESALERFLKANGFVKEVHPWNLLKDPMNAGAGNNARGLLMHKDADAFELVITQEFEVLPPQPRNFAFKVLAHGRTAGVCVYRPLALRYLTGMSTT